MAVAYISHLFNKQKTIRCHHLLLDPSFNKENTISGQACGVLQGFESYAEGSVLTSLRNVVEDHLIVNGFVDGYNKWIVHGERLSSRNTPLSRNHDDIDGLLHDTFQNIEGETRNGEGEREGLSEDAKRFFKLVDEGKKELYPGYRTEDDENVEKEGDDLSLLFPKLGHPIGNGKKKKGKTFTMDLELSSEVHRYVLFNTGDEQVEDFIKLSDVDMRWSREDIPFDVVDMPSDAQFSEDTTMGTSEKEDDFDDTDWDWMDAND
ncbi:hypothetical protein H5410_016066 [Solanum commersonii]|uniref:Transposase-associated domain-containing protein n=1 Tax=Solanum commersonii TaxID=4109 RepID=A0A9J5ZWA1_SOLCO|nr:hypothetical protein H5410_016066 [Solanum commersonii]